MSNFTNRRVVTGHDATGKAIFTSDDLAPVVHTSSMRPGFAINEIWITSGSASEMNAAGDPTDRPRSLEPPSNGTIYRMVIFPPEKNYIDAIGNDQASRDKIHAAYKDMGAPGAAVEAKDPRHPFMHRTKTVDYGIVLSGEMTLILDDSETVLRPGDTVVQRATNHAWSNRGDVPCVMLFVLFYLDKGPAV